MRKENRRNKKNPYKKIKHFEKKFSILCSALLSFSLFLSLTGCSSSYTPSSVGSTGEITTSVPVSPPSAKSTEDTAAADPASAGSMAEKEPAESLTHLPQSEAEIPAVITDFSVTLFQNSLEADHNTLISPLSVLYALGMAANGAKGETLSQMESVLGLPVSDLNDYLYTFSNTLPQGEKYKLYPANSIWLKQGDGFTPEEAFLQMGKEKYNADIYEAAFNTSTVREVNRWVSQHTDGMIDSILSDLSDDAVMILVNALAFDAKWQNIYTEDQIREGMFTKEDGSQQKIKLMYSEEQDYLKTDDAEGFIKYYADRKYAFAALLPTEGISIADFTASLTGEKIQNILSNPQDIKVKAAIPKFKSDYSIEMSQILQQMGMEDAFHASRSDFSGIGQSDNGPLYISQVMHKTFICLDENGTKAGAATTLVMNEMCAIEPKEPKTVYLNRPFVYMILDCETNIPVFIGTVMSVEE